MALTARARLTLAEVEVDQKGDSAEQNTYRKEEEGKRGAKRTTRQHSIAANTDE